MIGHGWKLGGKPIALTGSTPGEIEASAERWGCVAMRIERSPHDVEVLRKLEGVWTVTYSGNPSGSRVLS